MKSRFPVLAAFITLSLSSLIAYAQPPPNDNFASPTIITGYPVTAYGTNIDATIEMNEPLPHGYEYLVDKSIWFEWTAPTSGLVYISTYDSKTIQEMWEWPAMEYDMIAHPAVWIGNSLDELVEVRSGGSAESRYINVTSGTTYRIAVYGIQNGAMFDYGNIVLSITNDASSHIAGTVTGPDGTTPLQGILVQAGPPDGNWWANSSWDFTDISGQYTIRGLSNATYRVLFADWEDLYGYVAEYYDNAFDIATGDDIIIPSGANVTNINASLAEAAEISGTVTGPDGVTPLKWIDVSLRRWTGSFWKEILYTETDVTGNYMIGGIAEGTYRLRFKDWDEDYITEVYVDAPDLDSGTDIVITAGSSTEIDASLAEASKISGIVTGPDGLTPAEAILLLYLWNGLEWKEVSSRTAYNGEFSIGGLIAGTYRIEIKDSPYDNADYEGIFFDNQSSFASASDIILPSATTISNLTASLDLTRPRLIGLRPTAVGTEISFEGVEGRDYMLQRGIMGSNYWIDVGASITCELGTNMLNDADSPAQAIWRIRRAPETESIWYPW